MRQSGGPKQWQAQCCRVVVAGDGKVASVRGGDCRNCRTQTAPATARQFASCRCARDCQDCRDQVVSTPLDQDSRHFNHRFELKVNFKH